MKQIQRIGMAVGTIGILIMGMATVTGIGRWLYLWTESTPIGAAMWSGFLWFLSMIGIGLILVFLGLFIKEM